MTVWSPDFCLGHSGAAFGGRCENLSKHSDHIQPPGRAGMEYLYTLHDTGKKTLTQLLWDRVSVGFFVCFSKFKTNKVLWKGDLNEISSKCVTFNSQYVGEWLVEVCTALLLNNCHFVIFTTVIMLIFFTGKLSPARRFWLFLCQQQFKRDSRCAVPGGKKYCSSKSSSVSDETVWFFPTNSIVSVLIPNLECYVHPGFSNPSREHQGYGSWPLSGISSACHSHSPCFQHLGGFCASGRQGQISLP